MAIEKVFAVAARQRAIWDALWADLGAGAEGSFEIERSHWPDGFTLRLELAGLPVLLSYQIASKESHCEVSARLQPLSWRYGVYQVVTFGHLKRNYEMLLVQGLANLKRTLEPESTLGTEDI